MIRSNKTMPRLTRRSRSHDSVALLATQLLLLVLGGTTRRASALQQPHPHPHHQKQPHHQHEFWRKTRSHGEVKSHVTQCLADMMEEQDEHRRRRRRTTTSTENPEIGNDDSSPTPTVQVLSAEPPLVLIRDFLSPSMCQDLIGTARDAGNMRQSQTGNTQNVDVARTSTSVWLHDDDATYISRYIAETVAKVTGLPISTQENLQVARYQVGQEFKTHTDHQDSFNELEKRGRLATFLIYLDAPTIGGATHFPGVHDGNPDYQYEGNPVCVPPVSGSAIFFFNTVQKPGCDEYDAEMFLDTDWRMRHAGLPVREGEKWICNKWVHPVDFGAGVRGF